jgi:hypothetical protein
MIHKAIGLCILLVLVNSCSSHIGTRISIKEPPLSSGDFVLVLEKDDSSYIQGVVIGSVKSSDNGFSANCSYSEVIDQLKLVARQNCYQSWVMPEHNDNLNLLQHEQSRFDLCEVYARQLRKQFEERNLSVFNLSKEANDVFYMVWTSYRKRQEQYDKETNFGLNTGKQKEWDYKIAQELLELEKYRED